jgi:hypothetical protein
MPLREHRLDALVPVASAGLAVERCSVYRPGDLLQPGEAGMRQEIAAWARVAGDSAPSLRVHLRALAVELRFGDVRRVAETREVLEARREHGRDEAH